MPESITLASRVFHILILLFTSSLQFLVQLVRATLAQLLGYACPVVRLCVSDLAVTVSVRFCGGRFDSFLGFESVVLITLASHVFEYFLRFLLQACVICAFWLRWGVPWCDPPTFLPTLTFSSRAVPLLGFWASFMLVRATVALASIATTVTAPILLLALRSAALLTVLFRISRFLR